jgi:hypothetical protein
MFAAGSSSVANSAADRVRNRTVMPSVPSGSGTKGAPIGNRVRRCSGLPRSTVAAGIGEGSQHRPMTAREFTRALQAVEQELRFARTEIVIAVTDNASRAESHREETPEATRMRASRPSPLAPASTPEPASSPASTPEPASSPQRHRSRRPQWPITCQPYQAGHRRAAGSIADLGRSRRTHPGPSLVPGSSRHHLAAGPSEPGGSWIQPATDLRPNIRGKRRAAHG